VTTGALPREPTQLLQLPETSTIICNDRAKGWVISRPLKPSRAGRYHIEEALGG
jgi:hypothetical protein